MLILTIDCGTQAEAARVASMDTQAKQIDMAQKLFDMGNIDAANQIIDSLNLGGSDWHNTQTDNYNKGTSQMDGNYSQSGVIIPANSKFLVTSDGSGGINVDIPVDENNVCLSGREQCGEVVNDYLGSKIFGDSFENKKSKRNSYVAEAGEAFVMNTGGTYGHTGIVTKVYEDGSIDIIDSNRDGTGKVDSGHIDDPMKAGIVGYYNPLKSRQGSQYASVSPSVSESAQETFPQYNPLDNPTEEAMAEGYALGSVKMADITAYAQSQQKSPSKYIASQEMKAVQDRILSRATQKKERYDNPSSIEDLPSSDQNLVQELLDYTGDIEQLTSKRAAGLPQLQRVIAIIHQKDPNWTVADYNRRKEFIDSWKTGDDNTIKDAMNNASQNLVSVADAADQLATVGIGFKTEGGQYHEPGAWFGALEKSIAGFIGEPALGSYKQAVDIAAGNLSKVHQMKINPEQGEVAGEKNIFGAYWNTRKENMNAVDKEVDMMAQQMNTMKQHYMGLLGKDLDEPILDENGYAAIKSLHERGYVRDETWKKIEKIHTENVTPKADTTSEDMNLYNQKSTDYSSDNYPY